MIIQKNVQIVKTNSLKVGNAKDVMKQVEFQLSNPSLAVMIKDGN